jgi:hypothetical protein
VAKKISKTKKGGKTAPRRRSHYRPKSLPPLAEAGDLLTIEEFLEYSKLGRTTAFEMVAAGRLPSIRLGGRQTEDGRVVGGHIRIPKTVLTTAASV